MKEDAMQQDRAVDDYLPSSILLSAVILVSVLPTSIAVGQENGAVPWRTEINRWLQDWNNSNNPDLQQAAISGLFGQPAFGRGFHPPEDIKAKLFERKLDYDNWESRRTALLGFSSTYLVHDPTSVIPIFRDAMNDSHPDIRITAIAEFGAALRSIERGESGRSGAWDAATKARILETRDELVDMIVDQVITKGLTDENDEVVSQALYILNLLKKPQRTHLRALNRAIARHDIEPPIYMERAKKLQERWHREVHGLPEPQREDKPIPGVAEDPFAD